jgi:serine protease Do
MTRRLRHRSLIALAAVAALTVAACGSASESADTTTATVPDTEAPPDTEKDEPTTTVAVTEPGVNGFDAIQPSVIQIEAVGTIRDPEIGVTDGSGRGSGFIISDDGLAVTNNHVVTGAATLEVFVGGDTDVSYNATVLGVSECNDLALIDIVENEPLTPLKWFDGDITQGTEVYAAGFPLGDPEYTITRGIISKLKASGETSWASLDSVLEHDANIQPGNSGGPLVTTDGSVIGINYAGQNVTGTGQFFAIDSTKAQQVIDKLRDGDFEALGVNGEAVVDEAAGLAGIWVSGIQPGSPADKVGLLPGDIIQKMNGLPVGTDGTKADYCDVLRTSGDKPIQIEVLRFDTSEVLTGEINGDKPLEVTFSFANAVEEEVPVEEGTTTYDSYTTIVDDTGYLKVDVPTAWASLDTTPIVLDDGTQLGQITASTDIAAFNDGWTVPGLFYSAIPGVDFQEALRTFAPDQDCTDAGITDYQDAAFLGQYQVWTSCGGTDTIYVVLAAVAIDGTEVVSILAAQIVTEADLDALDQAFATFNTTS